MNFEFIPLAKSPAPPQSGLSRMSKGILKQVEVDLRRNFRFIRGSRNLGPISKPTCLLSKGATHPFAATMSSLKLMPLTKAAATAVEWQSTKPGLGADEEIPLHVLLIAVPLKLLFIYDKDEKIFCSMPRRKKMNMQ